MNIANVPQVDAAAAGLASWYTPGRTDGFGDRLLMFDNTDSVSLELLRFRRELAASNGFENALRDRVDQLGQFRHPSFAPVRAVVHLDDQDLTLVSAHTPGQRLSQLPAGKLRKGLHPALVTWIVREITPALAALQSAGPHVAHGALSADRVVLTPDGRLCVVEHTLGWAVRRLALTPAVFWRQFGLLAPVDDRGLVRIDPRTDVVQLGVIALSLLLARPVTLPDFQRALPALLHEFTAMAAMSPSVFAAPLRAWLERALQLSPRPYRSAADAQEALHELPVPTGPLAALGAPALQLPRAERPEAEHGADSLGGLPSVSRVETRGPLRPQPIRELPRDPGVPAPRPAPVEPAPTDVQELQARERSPRWKRAYTIALAVTLGLIALVEGVVIVTLGTQPAVVSVSAPIVPKPSAQPINPAPVAAAVNVPTVDIAPTSADDPAMAALAQAAARQRSGGIRWSTPIELSVLEGDRVLGSTADGPIVLTAGTHDVDLVNTALGFRTRQTVTVRPGVITPLTLPTPSGRININAQPWAQVIIDDKAVGETPLANVAIPLGQHQITFRHPQFGDRRETVTVRADAIARISITFDR